MEVNYFTILYWFCHSSTWIRHGCTRVPHPEPASHLPLRTILLGHPSAPAPSIQYPASNVDWWFISYMIFYMFQCHSPKSSHPLPLPQSPKDCSIHQCLLLSRTQRYHYHLSKFHIYALVYCIGAFFIYSVVENLFYFKLFSEIVVLYVAFGVSVGGSELRIFLILHLDSDTIKMFS